jgi:hypothetical protein
VPRRVVIVPLSPPRWAPPGPSADRWRRALADDVVDLLATLAEVDPALAVHDNERDFAASVAWPTMTVYSLPDLSLQAIFAAATADGYDQAAIIAPDAPDLPGMLVAKLLRPLTTRPVAVAPAAGDDRGLLGIASRLPAPPWLTSADLDTATAASVRAAAGRVTDVVGTPGWHRLRSPAALARLDPDLEGWEATRAILAAPQR